jgi:hypothetical protein
LINNGLSKFFPLKVLFRCSTALSVIFIAFLLGSSSCRKAPYEIGLTILPPSDTLNVKITDTVTIVAYSVIQDSIRSDKTTTNILGSLMDPIFGQTTASFLTQVRLSAEAPTFGTNPVLDSLVLVLRYSKVYGDSTSLQNVKVYELINDLSFDSIYYTNYHVSSYGTELANVNFRPAPHDSVVVGGIKQPPQLRLNLSRNTNYLGNKLLFAPSAALATNASFIAFMKGLYVKSSPVYSGGGLVSLATTSTTSKLVLYFHNNENDSLAFDFIINDNCARINTFNHNKYLDATPELQQQAVHHDTVLGKSDLYLQGLGGLKVKIRFPYLQSFEKGHYVAVTNAQLIIKNVQTDTTLAPPPDLVLVQVDSLGNTSSLIDENEGSTYFGGTYDRTSRTYKFRITQHIQEIILHKTRNNDLYLMVNNPTINVLVPSRVQVFGTQPPIPGVTTDKLYLQMSYTRLN